MQRCDFGGEIAVYFSTGIRTSFGVEITRFYYFKAASAIIAVNGHFFVVFFGHFDNLYHSFYVRRKHSDYNSVFCFGYDFSRFLDRRLFRGWKNRCFGVGAFQK